MTPRKAQHLSAMLLVIGMLTMLCAYVWEPLFFVGAVIAVSSLIPHFLFNRCPHCGKLLGKSLGKYCQFCGKDIEKS